MSYYEESHGPLAPPAGATSERLITTSTAASGNVNRVTCEGAGGSYTEYCPSAAQIGVVGPAPAGAPAAPCVSYCEMPDGKKAWTGEDPYNRWAPKSPGMLGGCGCGCRGAGLGNVPNALQALRMLGEDAPSSGSGLGMVAVLGLGIGAYIIWLAVGPQKSRRRA